MYLRSSSGSRHQRGYFATLTDCRIRPTRRAYPAVSVYCLSPGNSAGVNVRSKEGETPPAGSMWKRRHSHSNTVRLARSIDCSPASRCLSASARSGAASSAASGSLRASQAFVFSSKAAGRGAFCQASRSSSCFAIRSSRSTASRNEALRFSHHATTFGWLGGKSGDCRTTPRNGSAHASATISDSASTFRRSRPSMSLEP